MRRGGRNVRPDTLSGALENYTVPNLKKLAGLLESGLPTRKAELVALILRHLEDTDRLRQLWGSLDTLQQAAIAEVVHSPGNQFDADVFRAKYGQNPDWGQSRYSDLVRPTLLRLFIYRGIIPGDLRSALKAFVPPPRAVEIETQDTPLAAVTQQWCVLRLDTSLATPGSTRPASLCWISSVPFQNVWRRAKKVDLTSEG